MDACSSAQILKEKPQAAITWSAGDKYIFLVTQAIQRTSSKSLATQTAVHLHNLCLSNQIAFANPANFLLHLLPRSIIVFSEAKAHAS